MGMASKSWQQSCTDRAAFGDNSPPTGPVLMSTPRSRVAVVIASLGRPETVREVLEALDLQVRKPDIIMLSVTGPEDLPADIGADVMVVTGPKGLCRQRNRALEALEGKTDYIVFFDDDYVPSKFAVEGVASFFDAHPGVVGATGKVIKDGIKGPGIPYEDAVRTVAAHDSSPQPDARILRRLSGLYGCNMAFRASAIGETRFDEALPYYGWLEDNDFSNRLKDRGQLVHTNAFYGVHCGVKSARSPGMRLGYSQIANPVYLAGKGSLPRIKALKLMSFNVLANLTLSLHPEPWVDRWGRVKGNWLAFRHLVSGKLSPEFILQL